MAFPREGSAIVTGGGGGIGAAICERLAERYAIVVLDRDEAAASTVAERIAAGGRAAVAVGCDVTDAGALAAACERADGDDGPLSVLVNCAALSGTDVKGDVLAMTPAEWRRVIDVDLTGAFLAAQAAARRMAARGAGCIVNIASTSGLGAEERAASYCAAKAGLLGLTRALALDLAPHGIRVCAVAPGDIDTAAARRTRVSDPRGFPKTAPLGRGAPADVAEAVAFLAGPGGRFVTGTTLVVDGGLMAY